MTALTLDERIRFSIELALTAGKDDPELLARQDAVARQLGVTGAEVDAARCGWSFDARTSRAVALAMAESKPERWQRRQRALAAGFTMEACHEIEHLAAGFVAQSSGGPGRRS